MKTKTILIIVLSLLSNLMLSAQCPPGVVVLHTQAEVNTYVTNFPNCTKLTEKLVIGYEEGIMLSDVSDISGLASLDTIQANIFIRNNPNLSNLNGLNNLKYWSWSNFVIENNALLINLTGLEGLTFIGGGFKIVSNENLQSLTGLTSLTDVVSSNPFSIENNNALTNLTGLEALDRAQFLTIINNDNLINLEGISSLRSSVISIRNNQSLTSLQGINPNGEEHFYNLYITGNNSLIDLTGLETITETGLLQIIENENLINLKGLEFLREAGEGVIIVGNQNLTSLSGLDYLEESDRMFIRNNPNLTSIASLNHTMGISWLEIINNPQLMFCGVKAVCEVLAEMFSTIEINNNAAGCNSASEISCIDFGLSGFVFNDFNQNKIRDNFEGSLINQAVYITPNNLNVRPNSNGRYYIEGVEGTDYILDWVDDPNWSLSTDSSMYQVTFFAGMPENEGNDFGLFSNNPNHDFSVNVSSAQTRCNTRVKFQVRPLNEGAFIENGTIEIHFNELIDYAYAIPTPASVDLSNRIITYSFSNLYPFVNSNLELFFDLPGPANINDLVEVDAFVFRDDNGILVEAAQDTYASPIVCSFDPNDKLVNPIGMQEAHYTLKDEKLTYTLRFQNTGNIDAIDVEIRDTLDNNLNGATFKVLNSSHEVFTSRTNDGAISFLFQNIYLPAESIDELGSQGFVTYEIESIGGLADFTIIENTGHIYFDENPAIVTNTTWNTLLDDLSTSINNDEEKQQQVSLYPNPAKDYLIIEHSNNLLIDNVLLFDLTGKPVRNFQRINNRLRISNLPQGIYFCQIKLGTLSIVRKIIIL